MTPLPFPLRSLAALPLLLAMTLGAPPALAQGPAAEDAHANTREQDKDRLIADLLKRVEALERKLADVPAETTTAAPAAVSRTPPPAAPAVPHPAGEPVDEQDMERALERALVRQGGLVLPPMSFELEPRLSTEYDSDSSLQLINTGGQLQVAWQDLERSRNEASLALRVGLPGRSQLDIVQPFAYNHERRTDSLGNEDRRSSSGRGNLEIGLTKELLDESSRIPGTLVAVRWIEAGDADDFGSPTAVSSSFGAWQGSVTLIKRHDPMVFFGSLSHSFNKSRTLGGAHIDPGDSTGLTLGSILAVSPSTSLRFDVEMTRSEDIAINGQDIAGSSAVVAMFNTGFSFALSPRVLLGIEAGIGLTERAPDFRFEVSLPIRL